MRVDHRYFLVNGLRLHALDHGGEGRPILLVHGVTGQGGAWRDVAVPLSLWGRVLAVDLRGHGASQWSAEGAYGTDHHVADLAALLAELGQPADVVGLSWGGLIGLRLAARHPDLVRKLVVIDPPTSGDPSADDTAPERPYHFARHEDVVAWERAANPRATDTMIAHLAVTGTRPDHGGNLSRGHDPYFSGHWPFRLERFDDDWARIGVPALLVRAADSPVLSSEAFAALQAARPDIAAVTVAASGHLVPVENPLGLTDALVEFLGEAGIEDVDLGEIEPHNDLEGV